MDKKNPEYEKLKDYLKDYFNKKESKGLENVIDCEIGDGKIIQNYDGIRIITYHPSIHKFDY